MSISSQTVSQEGEKTQLKGHQWDQLLGEISKQMESKRRQNQREKEEKERNKKLD